MNDFAEIEKLWLEFRSLPYPESSAEEVKGICVITLDTFTAGCIDTFISGKGRLDKKRKSILRQSQKELEIVVDNLSGEGKTYFEKLLNLTDKIVPALE